MKKVMMTKSQVYAINTASEKLIKARNELQEMVNIVAEELKLDTVKEDWGLSKDMKSLEERKGPKIIPLDPPVDKK